MKKSILKLFILFTIINCTTGEDDDVKVATKFKLVVTAQDGGAVSSVGGSFEQGTEVSLQPVPIKATSLQAGPAVKKPLTRSLLR